MGPDDRTRARTAIDAVSDKHCAMSAMVGAAASWATTVSRRSQEKADDVAWHRATDDLTGEMSAGAWSYELRDYQPLVVWPQYGERLKELHDDLGTALLGPVIYKSVAGLAPANSARTVKHTIEAAWRDDRASGAFEGRLPEAAQIQHAMWQRHDEWVDEVACAADVLEQAGFAALWMRSTYSASVTDRLKRAVVMLHEVYAAAAWAENEPCVLMEWNRRDMPITGIANRVAFIIDGWMRVLVAGGLSEQELNVTLRALDDKYPQAVAVWRRMCASRVSSGLPAIRVPPAFHHRPPARRAS
jgi:hypothetical protein